ncbi:hypothetical protein FOXB_08762 [Fusarium oxysporum f. sp. conglutinans Fo5176]|uniref:Uncharacterized protein n=1 Tax=Fusarium oxysporum (strain Fo5176) TaxID=660025 RepID=F9FQT2_FUSOF|nr:hypothetical protein FOXB_08762 [Fusarium oxysporum f. sp. conglutinans Fo5176]
MAGVCVKFTVCAQSKTTGGVEAEKSDKTWRKQGEEGRERRQTQQEWCGKVRQGLCEDISGCGGAVHLGLAYLAFLIVPSLTIPSCLSTLFPIPNSTQCGESTKRQRNKEHRKKKGKSAAKAQKALSKGDHNGTV